MPERAEQALREALHGLGTDEPVDPEAARRRAKGHRPNGGVSVAITVALVLLAGGIWLPRLFPEEHAQPAPATRTAPESPPGVASTPTDPAPPGWRTEYYRDISFRVPDRWGYAVPPQGDWCADKPHGQSRAHSRGPYVWLGTDIPVRAIPCPMRPTSMLTEHVEALAAEPGAKHVQPPVREGGWWVGTRVAGSAMLIVTSRDAGLAERILDSAKPAPSAAPCAPSNPVAGPLGARPTQPTDLGALGHVDQVILCQYEPGASGPQLRAAHVVTGHAADQLVARMQSAPVNDSSCDPAPVDGVPDLAVLARMAAGDRTSDIYIAATGCPDGDSGMAGGVDDGTKLRMLTSKVCRSVLTPPLALFSGSGDVGRDCLG